MKKLKLSNLLCLMVLLLGLHSTVSAQITGVTTVCAGSTTTLSGAPSGGTWSLGITMIAVVHPTTGVVTGAMPGTATVTYTVLSVPTTATITVLATPPSISGASSICTGASTAFTNTAPGGTWASTSPVIASVDPVTGIVTGVSVGVASISYTLGTGCSTSKNVTVVPGPAAISGTSSLCVGATATLVNATSGGTWSSANSVIAVIGSTTGVATGVSAGTVTITYSLPTGCYTTHSLTVGSGPAPTIYGVVGGGSYCSGGAGSTITLSNSSVGVSYELFNGTTLVSSPIMGTGTAISFGSYTAAGTYTVKATGSSGCSSVMSGTAVISISPLPTVHMVTGGGAYCTGGPGAAIGLTSSATGNNYQLYLAGTPVGTPIAGTGSALSFGMHTAVGTYTATAVDVVTGCLNNMAGSAIVSVTSPVTPSVSLASSPGDTVCPGTSVTFTAIPVNGGSTPTYAWTVNGVAVVTSSVVYSYIPTNADVVTVTMTSSALCVTTPTASATRYMVVNYITPITGTTTVCAGATTTLMHATSGGAWSSSDITVATVTSAGVVTGVAGGTATITYLLPTGCYATAVVTVNALPTITASSSASSCGPNHTLTAGGATTYSWTPTTGLSCPTCAVTTITPAATTTFTVAGTDASGCTNTNTVTVTADRIYGHITFSAAIPDTLDMKVWLIQFNPSDSSITALDSTTTCPIDSVGYYEFNGKAAGSYLVKAKMVYSKPVGTSGYLPTYGLSTPNWYAATSATHTTGSSDTLHITMAYGTVPAGPGFIGGYVYAGAGKGTSGETGVAGMIIYLKNAAGNVITYTYTDGTGAYSFPAIAYGDYYVTPEEFDFNTIGSDKITLSAETPSAAAVSFKQYATSRVIKPYAVGVGVKTVVVAQGISVYPNPSNGALNIQWIDQPNGSASVTISDMMGREVFTSVLNIGATNGAAILDLNKLTNGVYMISVNSANISYTSKLLIQK